ncbi:glutamate--cysteine ligase [Amycolatopsis acidiphila]|uniref:Putative glutamate--cysteine ligase 2 n=1 Tax=Amycolatopsis acidiphila TaxID=715473 RepID=A0A558AKP5_9PSEU|nr:glutamate--cysteine ligase [Amycolatopsis acidiphila]TVT24781.1 YbdK family carboxylate-amine ligase [Amycolatopsis acidiphila]UIJ62754.1 glutamate--cysteine ligase [Amycolatopsis acidiphila]GHG63977.1 putative glutamate--cysteine ligase 2 [Amycolatopsis acidiphila]
MSEEHTFGVEEEFLLVDADGRPAAAAPAVLRDSPEELQPEMVTCQVESVTPVCEQADELLEHLRAQRAQLVDGARARGLRLLASGTSPVEDTARLTPGERYRRIADHFRGLMDTVNVCGCHVHVGVPDASVGVEVLNHLRPWLPVLLALSANSPFADGADTGYASWRYLSMSRWPSGGPPPYVESVAHYESLVGELAESGAVLDAANLYWDIRLSPRHPTVEVRVCDVAVTAEEAALLAVLVQGLAASARSRIAAGEAAEPVPQEVLRADLWRAARDGLGGRCADPLTRTLRPAHETLRGLFDEVRPQLRDGAKEFAEQTVGKVLADGGGAARQRAAFARRGDLSEVVAFLAGQTEP